MASPSASARTPISAGTSVSSTGVEATHTPSRQWLSTIFLCSGCLVIRSVAPWPRSVGNAEPPWMHAMSMTPRRPCVERLDRSGVTIRARSGRTGAGQALEVF